MKIKKEIILLSLILIIMSIFVYAQPWKSSTFSVKDIDCAHISDLYSLSKDDAFDVPCKGEKCSAKYISEKVIGGASYIYYNVDVELYDSDPDSLVTETFSCNWTAVEGWFSWTNVCACADDREPGEFKLDGETIEPGQRINVLDWAAKKTKKNSLNQ